MPGYHPFFLSGLMLWIATIMIAVGIAIIVATAIVQHVFNRFIVQKYSTLVAETVTNADSPANDVDFFIGHSGYTTGGCILAVGLVILLIAFFLMPRPAAWGPGSMAWRAPTTMESGGVSASAMVA